MSAKKIISLLVVIIPLALGYFGIRNSSSGPNYPQKLQQASNYTQPTTSTGSQSATQQVLGQQTKTTGCVANNGLPDNSCTPGAIISTATKDQICVSGYSKSVRNVPAQEKQQVYSEYGIASHSPGQYEVDHLISLELGGSNDISNLWPEAAEPRPGFHEKDMVENYLHQQVCSGAITVQQAQQQVSSNWLQVYQNTPNIQQFQMGR